jgi:hypothetical protein
MIDVMCINNSEATNLITVGKIYKAEDIRNDYVKIYNPDNGEDFIELYAYRFRPLDCNYCTVRKCNSCLVDKKRK